jgi:hypothetical protein
MGIHQIEHNHWYPTITKSGDLSHKRNLISNDWFYIDAAFFSHIKLNNDKFS